MEKSTNTRTIELILRAEDALATSISDGDLTPKNPLEAAEKFSGESVPYQPIFASPSRHLSLVRHGRRYRTESPTRLANNLLASVGFLEAANAGDFAANVWNKVPVPTYAVVLMAIGGAVALGMTFFAAKDAMLSWQNIRGLRAERIYLHHQREQYCHNIYMQRTIDCLLDINFRETGTEWMDRVGMDILMGFGALMIGVGTILAIFGANRAIFKASNLLSGYIGNVPCSIFGLANLAWSLYVWRRAFRHGSAGSNSLRSALTSQKILRRTSSVKLHGVLNGVAGLVAAVASLITATRWWGYVLLAPCVVAAVVANFLWRHRIGYTRPFVQKVVPLSEDIIEAELDYVDACQRQTEKSIPCPDVFASLVLDPTSLTCALDFLSRHDLFEDFCIRVLADAQLRVSVGDKQGKTITLEVDKLAVVDRVTHDRLLGIAKSVVADSARRHFVEQERYLLEALGCYLCSPAANPSSL